MLLRSIVVLVGFALVPLAAAPPSKTQQVLMGELEDYHKDIATFERVAAEAVRAGVPEVLVTLSRLLHYVQHGEFAPAKLLLAEVEKRKAELLEQQVSPISPGDLERLLTGLKAGMDAAEKDPARVARAADGPRKRVQARSILRDLKMLDLAVNAYGLENNGRGGEAVPLQAWMRVLPAQQTRLARTGADCLGNSYGAQVVGKRPVVPRKSYELMKDAIPPDFFKPFEIGKE